MIVIAQQFHGAHGEPRVVFIGLSPVTTSCIITVTPYEEGRISTIVYLVFDQTIN